MWQKSLISLALIYGPVHFKHSLTFQHFLFLIKTIKHSFDNSVKFLVTNVESGAPLRPALLLSLSLQCPRLDTATNPHNSVP